MKNIKTQITVFIIITLFNYACAQQSIADKKYIEVTGSAEMSIQPDEVEIAIVLYESRNDFPKREDQLLKICKKYHIDENQLSFNHSNSGIAGWDYWWYWWYYRNSSYLTQTYKLKVTTKNNIMDLVKELNKPWVRNITIGTTTNKDLQVYRKEVKKEAIKMAKEKATYLLEAIDESIGSVISIEEVIADNNTSKNGANGRYWNGYGWYWDNPYYGDGYNSNTNTNSNMSSNSVMSSGNSPGGNSKEENELAGLSKIKLRYEVKAKFEIK
jgi:hypothetical protein